MALLHTTRGQAAQHRAPQPAARRALHVVACAPPASSNGGDTVTFSFASNGSSPQQQQQQQQQQPEPPSVPVAAAAAPAPQPAPQQPPASTPSSVIATKLALLELVAGLDRGALADANDKAAVERLVAQLEASGAGAQPLEGSPAPVEGRWELIYANTETFRASPFFQAFANAVGNESVSSSIFAFTDAIPGATIATAYQTVSLLGGSLISEVDMALWPGLNGTVVTSCRVSPSPPRRLELVVENTRVTGSSFSPFLDAVAVPVESLITGVAGAGAARGSYDITYVDQQLRVSRAGSQLLLHRRVL